MVRLLAHRRYDVFEQAAAEEEAVFVALQFEPAAVDDELRPFLGAEIDIGAHLVEMLAVTSGPISASGSVPGRPSAPGRACPLKGFGYAVMNLGLGSADSIIHTEMMQGFRPSGVTSEQLTSNF